MDVERQERLRILARMQEPFKDVPHEEIEREVAYAIAKVRREMQDEAGCSRQCNSRYAGDE